MLLFPLVGWAQGKQVSGVVIDELNEPLVGATVVLKGVSATGTLTDLDGKFLLNNIKPGSVLVVSYVGYISTEIKVGGQNMYNVQLKPDTQTLDEVVVIGYGTVKKKDLTGSVSSVSGESLRAIPVTNVAQTLTGRLAGVQITSTDGSPDAEMIIRVRGGGSITGDNSPLYIVDGFPVNSINDIAPSDIETIDVLKDASSTAIYGSQGANGVVIITTKGARSGKTQVSYNGYMQFKQMRNKADVLDPYEFAKLYYEKARITSDTEVAKFEKLYGVYDDLELWKNAKATDWQEDMFGVATPSQQHNISISGGSDNTKFNLSTTYSKDYGLMKNNDYSRFNVNFKLNHKISKNLKVNFNVRFSDAVVNGAGSTGENNKIRTYDAIRKSPVENFEDRVELDTSTMTEDEYNSYIKGKLTISELADQYWKKKKNTGLNFTGAVDWKILKGLSYRLEGGYNYGFNEEQKYWGPYTATSNNDGQNLPIADWNKSRSGKYRIANTLTYNLNLKEHKFNILAGQEIVSTSSNNNYMKAKYFSKDLSPERIFANMGLNSGELGSSNVSSYISPDDRIASFFGRIGYNYKERYLLTLTFRADGSSKFASGNQWGYFPAGAFAWRIIEEPFMAGTKEWMSNLKLRAGYGTAGNNRIASSLYKLDYKIYNDKTYGQNGSKNPYYAPTNSIMANPKLKWETTVTRNLGLDFGFFNERLSGTIDAYWNTTKDLLLQSKIVAAGYEAQQQNIGQTSNRGIEFSLNGAILQKKNYSLSANFNINFNRSKVDKLADGITTQEYSAGWITSSDVIDAYDYRVIVGEPVGLIYGYITDGYYTTSDFAEYTNGSYIIKTDANGNPVAPTSSIGTGTLGVRPGVIKFKDISGPDGKPDGKIDSYDATVIGKTTPKFTGGFGLTGTFYNFDCSIMFNWVYGNKVYNTNKLVTSQTYNTSSADANLLSFMEQNNRYSYIDENGKLLLTLEELAQYNEGKNAKAYWSPLSFADRKVVVHSWAIEDGSYLRLQDITLGYTVPQKWTRKFACQQLRVYGTLNNVWCWTNYSGYDPEVSTSGRSNTNSGLTPGVDFSSYPKSFSWTMGVNVTF